MERLQHEHKAEL